MTRLLPTLSLIVVAALSLGAECHGGDTPPEEATTTSPTTCPAGQVVATDDAGHLVCRTLPGDASDATDGDASAEETTAPTPVACAAVSGTLACGLFDGDASGGARLADAQRCVPGAFPGPEAVLHFTAPLSGRFVVSVFGGAGAFGVSIVPDEGAGCDYGACVAGSVETAGDAVVSFLAVEGQAFFVVVDATAAGGGPFRLQTACQP